ncbi:hypothetical protein TREES_T100013300 [Tupaia chinensis]|uniref:Uncharacterized protein n=1 Tax=Tupaia chinensis TaxID=246437 RepID=L9KL75_TUPCH|nr:hypothetical protein TREES_T100013300 [Tupaia chinensis]
MGSRSGSRAHEFIDFIESKAGPENHKDSRMESSPGHCVERLICVCSVLSCVHVLVSDAGAHPLATDAGRADANTWIVFSCTSTAGARMGSPNFGICPLT